MVALGGFRESEKSVQSQPQKSLILGLLLAAVFSIAGCQTAPPVQEMSDARQAIAVAKEAGAAQKAAFHLKAAEDYLASAEQRLLDHQYSQARYDAKQAKMKALDALKASEAAREPAEDDSQ